MMDNKKASDFFRKEDKLNCAQAVLKYYETHKSVTPDVIADFKSYGGGRAPEGLCGALYAAKHVFGDEDKTCKAEEVFIEAAGSVNCREIRKANKLSCTACVDLAGECLKKHL